ncbi:endopeptidase La, partial [bacterium]|nr:endopeptidase La [bacterium]
YLEVDFDLSQVLFITTANLRHDIPIPLQDRMEIIEIHGYLRYEKLQIARGFLLPKQIREHGLKDGELILPDETILAIIDVYTRESGVRELERQIARICRKVAHNNIQHPGREARIVPGDLEKYLGIPLYKENLVDTGDRVGSAVGLAWNSMGGDILNIQATLMKGKGNLLLTGRLGEVMKESAQAAVSFLRSRGAPWGVPGDFLKLQDVHIHIPEGATPKDGPSAGITLATALLSAIAGRPVPPDVAMTGEITLRGNVLPIGGLAEKVVAAKRAKINTLYVPEANRVDWFDLDPELREGTSVHFVENVEQLWNHVFPRTKKSTRASTPRARTVTNRRVH